VLSEYKSIDAKVFNNLEQEKLKEQVKITYCINFKYNFNMIFIFKNDFASNMSKLENLL